MECFVLIILIAVILFLVFTTKKSKKKKHSYDSRGFDNSRIHKNGTKYDDFGFDFYGYDIEGYNREGYNREGYNREGYNRIGKNIKGQYNRFFDTTACDNDGFYDPKVYPIAFSSHAKDRFGERLGITDLQKMNMLTIDAYRFGKSKRQIKKTSAYLVDEIEQKYDNSIVLIYKNVIYIFSCDNILKTLYKNDKIPL